MLVEIQIDPSETDVEAVCEDTPSMVRLVTVRFGRVVLKMDAHTWVLANPHT